MGTKKGLSLVLAAVLSIGTLTACGSGNDSKGSAGASGSPAASVQPSQAAKSPEISGTVTSSGSTALLPLVKQAAEDFMDKNPKVTVNATGGGSGQGIKNVLDGTSQIGNSDVEASAEDKSKLVDHVVAIAPFALIVSKDVTVDNLTKQQAADIYTGKITNWKDVGGKDQKISLVHRQDSSGSRKLVQQIVLEGKDFSKEGVVQDASKTVAEAVAGGSGAIGYVDTPYITDKVKALKIDGVAYSKETIKGGQYKLYGMEHMYTKGQPEGATKAFLEYIMSKEFQDTQVEKLGFLPANLLSGK
ncbi:phosphate ABC transporter substrate-binding protein [Paenibacillus sp. J31TS4]|uniref:phosphate ABC transporter substrate-binding protein n=1 Tax=Paenibacillus sp. J31TS4 TaxID=2807195 RepID=UPI001B01CCFD|nr:phosphate ABC transporter substrate-binding protein [Paenibacillus sp. J31TS4]GIP38232.1 phosphate ABC transporter substrate-binding protein [Paenibacillus sp. J31TS4]